MTDEPEQAEVLSELQALRRELEILKQEAQNESSARSHDRAMPTLSSSLKEMRIGILLQDDQARIVESNDAAAVMLGIAPDALRQMSSRDTQWDVIGEDESPFLPEQHPVSRVLATGKPVHDVVMGVHRFPEQERVWLLVNADPMFDAEGRVSHAICYFTDISERKRMEAELRASESRYRFLFESSPLPTWVYDTDTLHFLAVNRAAVLQYGYSEKEFLCMTFPELRGKTESSETAASRPAADEPESSKHLRKDGTLIDVRVTSQTMRLNHREACMVIAENITERKQAERALRKLNRRMVNILESIGDGFTTLDKQGVCTYLNSRAGQMLHTEREVLVGRNFWEVLPALNNTPFSAGCQKAAARQTPTQFEHFLPHLALWLKVNVYPSQDGLSIYMTDITENKRVEGELKFSIESLKRSVDGIVRAMSYAVELRDPYTAGHQRRVSLLVCAMARQIGMGAEDIERFRVAALLHDIGKIAMPAEILSKPGQLSKPEMSIIQGHAQLGFDILKGIDFAPQIAKVALQHHERLDGSGYPNGLSGNDIIHEARMMAVADVVEAMASHRPFRPSLGIEKALNEVLRNKGVLYDPEAVEACLAAFAQNGFDFEHLMRVEQAYIPQEEK